MTRDLKTIILGKVKTDLAEIETALHDNLKPNIELVSDIAGHLLFSGGKRLRPLLMVLSARMCDYRGGLAIQISTIFEYLHAATLLHDDVVDGADIRRGKAVAHTRWSTPKVVLAGDFLLARSLSLAARTGMPAIIDIMAGITEAMSQGEIDQMEKRGNPDFTEEEYLQVIKRKTAVLIQGACRSGAILAGVDEKKEQALSDFGYHLGMAFQMADDLLDYTADAGTMGKNPGADIREGKLTLPLIHALASATPDDARWIKEMITSQQFNKQEFQQLKQKLFQYGGIGYTRKKAAEHVAEAEKNLELFSPSESKEIMGLLAAYAISRKV